MRKIKADISQVFFVVPIYRTSPEDDFNPAPHIFYELFKSLACY